MKTLLGSDKLRDAYPKVNENFTDLKNEKVDKITGKGLSDENYSIDEKNKVANVPADTVTEIEAIDAQLAQTVQDVDAVSNQLADKVSKLQPDWLDLTPLNGWSLETDGFLKIRKSETGLVTLRYKIYAGTTTPDSNVFGVPVGYRPFSRHSFLGTNRYKGQTILFLFYDSGAAKIPSPSSFTLNAQFTGEVHYFAES